MSPQKQHVKFEFTWQHTTLTTDRQTCPRRDPNPKSQSVSGRRPMS